MKPWKVVALLTLPMLLFAAWRIWSIYKERHEPVAVKQEPPQRKISQDDLVIPRKMYIESLKSAKQELKVEGVVEVATPAHWVSRIPRGSKNIFLVFRKPGDRAEYAVPMGEVDGGSEEFRMDDLLYYDDPHKLYSHWPGSVWQAIDQHQVKPGMSEMQTMMAVGQVS